MNLKNTSKVTMIAAAALLLVGCSPVPREPYAPQLKTPVEYGPEVLGYSIMQKPIYLYTVGYGPEKVLVLAAMHGDEPAGVPLAYKLLDRMKTLRHLHEKYTVMIIPVANPDGLAANTRFNSNGIDLNRNFPAANRLNSMSFGLEPLTEPEARVLHDLILDRRPARVISIHQPLNCIDYDGPGEAIANAMGQYCPLPINKLGSRSGSFGSFCGLEQGIPIITVELPESDSNLSAEELWNLYGYAMLSGITFPNTPF